MKTNMKENDFGTTFGFKFINEIQLVVVLISNLKLD